MVADSNSLTKLTERRIVQTVAQFRLTHEHNLEKFAIVCLQIGQQAHLFEQVVGQVLGFVDDKHRLAVLFDLTEQKQVDLLQRLQTIQSANVQTELQGNGPHELVGVED